MSDDGLELEGWPRHWASWPAPDPAAFFDVIAPFLPPASHVAIEAYRDDLDGVTRDLMRRLAVPSPRRLRTDAVDASSVHVIHLPATQAVLAQVGAFIRTNPGATWGRHVKAHDARGLHLHWHDADGGWPLVLSARYPAEAVVALGRALGCAFEMRPRRA